MAMLNNQMVWFYELGDSCVTCRWESKWAQNEVPRVCQPSPADFFTGDPQVTMGFNPKMVVYDLDDFGWKLGLPPWQRKAP